MKGLALLLLLPTLTFAETPGLFLPPPNVPAAADAPCLVCRGAGKIQAEDRGVQSSTSGKTKFVTVCTVCRGIGHHLRPLTPDERIDRQRTQRQHFDREQLAAGHIPVAGAYAVRGATDNFPPEVFAKAAQRSPRPCKECFGLGFEPCNKCKGLGKVTERERDEKGELVETPVNCPQCNGSGMQTCRKCDGGGLLPLCKKCSGTGVTATKARRNIPAGTERCRSCKGEGRR